MADFYKVKSIKPFNKIDADGNLVVFNKIEATTKNGIKFSVDLPDADTTPEKAKEALLLKAKSLEAVLSL